MSEILIGYVIPVALLVVIVYLLIVLLKVHGNARTIESPHSIVQQMRGLQMGLKSLETVVESGHRDAVSSVVRLQDEGFHRLIDDSLKRSQQGARTQEQLVRILGEQSGRFSEIEAILAALRDQASNSDQQLRRFQDGYNYSINKTVILAVIRILDEVSDALNCGTVDPESEQHDVLEMILEHLEILLSNEGIIEIQPPEDAEFAQYRSWAKAISKPTVDPSKANKIARVVRKGYEYDNGTEPRRLIRAAEVEVYTLETTSEGAAGR